MKRLWPNRLGPQMALLTVGLLVAVQFVSIAVFALMLPRSVPAFEPGWLVERLASLADGAMAQPAAARPAWLEAQPEARWFTFHFDALPDLLDLPQEAQTSAWLTTMLAAQTKHPWARIDVSIGRPRAVGPIAPPRLERIPPQSAEVQPMPTALVSPQMTRWLPSARRMTQPLRCQASGPAMSCQEPATVGVAEARR
jgi:hypothetical protein